MIEKNYLELFSEGINSSYFYYFLSLNSDEKNFFINSYVKNKIKENLIILSEVFLEDCKKILSFRLKNEFGTTHLNVKVKKLPILTYDNLTQPFNWKYFTTILRTNLE